MGYLAVWSGAMAAMMLPSELPLLRLDHATSRSVVRYDDDEEGSPWTLTLHVDERADEHQRGALELVFLDELRHLPWIRKARARTPRNPTTAPADPLVAWRGASLPRV